MKIRSTRLLAHCGALAMLALTVSAWLVETARTQVALGPVFCKTFPTAGTYWISLPATNPIRSAEELLTLIPNATTVKKLFPNSTPFTFPGGPCDPSAPLTLGCPTSSNLNPCFCINPGEGFQVTVSATSVAELMGIDSSPTIQLTGGDRYLISLPFGTTVTNAKALMDDIGFASVGSVMRYLTATDTLQIYTGRKNGGLAFPIVPGTGYGVTVINTTNYVPSSAGPVAAPSCFSLDSDYGLTGMAATSSFSWEIQDANSGTICQDPPGNLTPGGDGPVMAQDFTLDINDVSGTCASAGASAVHPPGAPYFTITYTGGPAPPILRVGPAGGPLCTVNTATACTFNPTVSLIVLPPPDPQRVWVNKSGADALVSWNNPGDPVLTWNVYRSVQPNPAFWGAPLAVGVGDSDPVAPGFQYLDVGAIATPDSYYYKVTAANDSGESPL